jgi:hypothetical protein
VTGVEIRPLWRAAALAALVAFLWLPRGHLAGHDEVAAARAHPSGSAAALSSVPVEAAAGERAQACPLCLSLSKVRSTLAVLAGAESPAPTAASPLAATRSCHVAEAFVSAHTAPRAPPAA